MEVFKVAKDLTSTNNDFGAVISIIENAKGRALKAVNAELINMYWEVGEYLSKLCAESSFGDKVIDEVADYISEANPTIKGFNRRGLYRMKQFYELYKDDEKVSTLLTQLSWSNHLKIMSACKSNEDARAVGVEWAIAQSKELMKFGVPALHFYTLGQAASVRKICSEVF